jgi:hypothetical protein
MSGDKRGKLIDLTRLYVDRVTEELAENDWRKIKSGRPRRDESARPPTLPPHRSWKGGLTRCSSTSSRARTSSA